VQKFQISAKPPNGTEDTSEVRDNGQVSLTLDIDTWQTAKKEYTNGTGQYEVTIHCHNCGDDSAFLPIGGLRVTPDTGNDWTFEVSYKYYQKKE
jgi:hypothetical protein